MEATLERTAPASLRRESTGVEKEETRALPKKCWIKDENCSETACMAWHEGYGDCRVLASLEAIAERR